MPPTHLARDQGGFMSGEGSRQGYSVDKSTGESHIPSLKSILI